MGILGGQWLGLQLPELPGDTVDENPRDKSGTQVWSLVQEDSTCHGATKSMCHTAEPRPRSPRTATAEALQP